METGRWIMSTNIIFIFRLTYRFLIKFPVSFSGTLGLQQILHELYFLWTHEEGLWGSFGSRQLILLLHSKRWTQNFRKVAGHSCRCFWFCDCLYSERCYGNAKWGSWLWGEKRSWSSGGAVKSLWARDGPWDLCISGWKLALRWEASSCLIRRSCLSLLASP
jgi:hypothetical protein